MIPAGLADLIRYADAVLATLLALGAAWSAVLADRWDQRVRFGAFAAFAFLLASGHLDSLGDVGSWRLAALIVTVTAALVAVGGNLHRELRESRELREARERLRGT